MRAIFHAAECSKKYDDNKVCICDELGLQLVQSYVPVREDLSTPVGPYSSLASMIRQARRDGLLKPVQNYVDHTLKGRTP